MRRQKWPCFHDVTADLPPRAETFLYFLAVGGAWAAKCFKVLELPSSPGVSSHPGNPGQLTLASEHGGVLAAGQPETRLEPLRV